MAKILVNIGEEFIIKFCFTDEVSRPSSIDMGLYEDATDQISDTDDLSAITTEPTGASYSRQSVSFGNTEMSSNDNTNGDWEVQFVDQTFDTSDSTQSVDSYFIVINFQSEDTGDSASQDHLFLTGALSQTFDLSNLDNLDVSDSGGSIT